MRASIQHCSWIRALSGSLVARENTFSRCRFARRDYVDRDYAELSHFYEANDDPTRDRRSVIIKLPRDAVKNWIKTGLALPGTNHTVETVNLPRRVVTFKARMKAPPITHKRSSNLSSRTHMCLFVTL